ncbi:c-type cytochrome biogenesis protein CcmI [Alteromonas sp. ASW11-130]|uniref:c-type cytochrome biogenesis protein CcmI n=1 Tax=Alteromonas sp. ASW11-130 TaxID=3015775 RepID=UPI002241A9C5|nr:c-type cytochrome biogenesis protein CcmI [Alteromonas sp. ASW11-130]MCW8092831.1 c-type cytochrome biogenesis protein CcmI [Alteromonas sp. ASW11-130]
MSWLTFTLVSVLLVALLIFFISLPWWRSSVVKGTESVNTKIVKQRLAEIEGEVEQGLISEEDKEQAVKELKIALVDETKQHPPTSSSSFGVLSIGASVALVIGGMVYLSANQLSQVKVATDAINALPSLSEKLADGSASDFTPRDVTSLTLAIRQRLRIDPTDVQGWVYLGRLWMAAGQQQQAIDSLEKASRIAPENVMVSVTLAQMLTATGETVSLRKAQRILFQLIEKFPENDNFALLLSVASAQLGDLSVAKRYFEKVKAKLSPESNIYNELSMRIGELEKNRTNGNQPQSTTNTGFEITVDIASNMKEKLPADGYLIVFAQDADSNNRIPAAVIKVPLQNFPRQLALTNDNAMMPDYTLSHLQNVKLVARISTDEDVMPKAGELEGQVTTHVAKGSVVNHSIIIDKELQ